MSATTFVPTYAAPGMGFIARGGSSHFDLDYYTNPSGLITDARGGLSLVTGPDRLANHIYRAISTEQGSWWADPGWGSTLVPGIDPIRSLPIQLDQVVLAEIARYNLTPGGGPADQISDARVTATQLASDPRYILLDIVLYDGTGTISQRQLQV